MNGVMLMVECVCVVGVLSVVDCVLDYVVNFVKYM